MPGLVFRRGRRRSAARSRRVTAIMQSGHWPPRALEECRRPHTGQRICGLMGLHGGRRRHADIFARVSWVGRCKPCTGYFRIQRGKISGNLVLNAEVSRLSATEPQPNLGELRASA